MQFRKFKILHLLLAILVIALITSSVVEQRTVIGKSSTRSPDGNWTLNLQLIEHSTLFSSRKVLDAGVDHSTNDKWDVSTSVPLNEADARTISNEHPDCPIVWSDDSTTVNYWINEKLEDSIKIETGVGQFKFQRDLYSTTVTHYLPDDSAKQ